MSLKNKRPQEYWAYKSINEDCYLLHKREKAIRGFTAEQGPSPRILKVSLSEAKAGSYWCYNHPTNQIIVVGKTQKIVLSWIPDFVKPSGLTRVLIRKVRPSLETESAMFKRIAKLARSQQTRPAIAR
jgi:hypothetical protein